MRVKTVFFIAALLTALCVTPAMAEEEPEIDVVVTAGLFDENTPGWVPVLVRLENKTDRAMDLTVTLSVYSDAWSGKRSEPIFSSRRQVTLSPAKSSPGVKLFYMYLYTDSDNIRYVVSDRYGRPMLLEVRPTYDGGTENIHERGINNLILPHDYRHSYNVVLIAENPNALYDFDKDTFNFAPDKLTSFVSGHYRYGYTPPSTGIVLEDATGRVKYLERDALPDHWIAYASADVIVLNGGDMDTMSSEKKQAIVDYVRMGGTLVISPPSKEWLLSGKNLINQLITIEKVEEIRLGDAHYCAKIMGAGCETAAPYFRIKAACARCVHSDDSEVTSNLVKDNGGQVIAQLVEINNGRVFILPIDVSHKAYAQSGLAKFFLQTNVFREPEIIDPDYGSFGYYGWGWHPDHGPLVRNEMARLLDLSNARLLPMWLVTLIALIYIGLVAPANFLALKKWGRPLLFAASVPIIVVIYTGMIFMTGYVYKGSSNLYSGVEIVEATSGSGTGESEHYSGIYSASMGGFGLEYDVSTVPCPFFLTLDKQRETRMEFDNYPGINVRRMPLSLWEMGYINSRGPKDLAGGVDMKVVDDGYRICRITNNTQFDLERGVLAYKIDGKDCFRLFPHVEKGATVSVELKRGGKICRNPLDLSRLLDINADCDEFPNTAIEACIYDRFSKMVERSRAYEVVMIAVFNDDEMPFNVDASMKEEMTAHFMIVRLLSCRE